jgi:hypothetical protein
MFNDKYLNLKSVYYYSEVLYLKTSKLDLVMINSV